MIHSTLLIIFLISYECPGDVIVSDATGPSARNILRGCATIGPSHIDGDVKEGKRALQPCLHFRSRDGRFDVWPWLSASSGVAAHDRSKEISWITHGTVNNIVRYLPILLSRWPKLIDCVVTIRSIDDLFMLVRLVTSDLWNRVNLHVISPIGLIRINSLRFLLIIVDRAWTDTDAVPVIDRRFPRNYELPSTPGVVSPMIYAANLARNIGLGATGSAWVVIADADVLPGSHFSQLFAAFLAHADKGQGKPLWTQKIAFVAPCFEFDNSMDANLSIPGTVADLKRLWLQGMVRPFYQEVCPLCQSSTNYPSWFEHSMDCSEAEMMAIPLYEVEWFDPYEPFFIAPAHLLPDYDERFVQYGKNRLTQIYEMFMAGWDFLVMNNIFFIHDGFKRPQSFHSTCDQELATNKDLFSHFKKEIDRKYGHS